MCCDWRTVQIETFFYTFVSNFSGCSQIFRALEYILRAFEDLAFHLIQRYKDSSWTFLCPYPFEVSRQQLRQMTYPCCFFEACIVLAYCQLKSEGGDITYEHHASQMRHALQKRLLCIWCSDRVTPSLARRNSYPRRQDFQGGTVEKQAPPALTRSGRRVSIFLH